MTWNAIGSTWTQYLLVINLALILLWLVQAFWILKSQRRIPAWARELEQRMGQALATRTAELEGRIQACLQAQQSQREELRRWVREESRAAYPRPEPEPVTRLDKRHQVYSLAQMGLDSRDISRKLRLPLGETELLLGIWENFNRAEKQHDRTRLH